MDLIGMTDAWMTRRRISFPGKSNLYPSEASVKWTDAHGIERAAGACLRKVYYRLTDGVKATPPDAYTEWIFALGKAVEEILVEQWKEMGIWVANNVKFFDETRNISGEIDVLIKDPETSEIIPVECKSFAGYQATKGIIGNKSTQGRPKTSQMLQTLVYLDICKDTIPYAKMIYYARDSGYRTQYDIALAEVDGGHYPTINGVIDYRFTIEDMFRRYEEVQSFIDNRILPPRDYALSYDATTVEQRKAIGEVSDSAYKNWKRNKQKYPIGDWQCRYCQFCNQCYQEDK